MKIRAQLENAFTLIELLVVIAIIAILAGLAAPALTQSMTSAQMTQTLNNGRQIYVAALAMANDGVTQGDSKLGWPGDLANSTAPDAQVTDVKGYMQRLMDYNYLAAPDVIRVCTASGVTPWDGTSGTFNGDKNCAFKIYRTTSGDGASNLFAATKNFKYNAALDATKDPYKDKGFVVIRRAGDGGVYKKPQATSIRILGLLPGRSDFTANTSESDTDTLTQQ